MMIFYKKYNLFIILFVLFVAISCTFWFGVLPLKQSIEKKMQGIQEFYASRENRERQIGELPILRERYESIVENEKTLNVVIAENGVVDFVKTLERLAGEMNVVMDITSKDNGKIIEVKKPESKTSQTGNTDQSSVEKSGSKEKEPGILDFTPFDRYLFLNIKIEGRYEDIVAFLGRVESLPFGLDVIKVDMKKKDVEKDLSSVNRGNLSDPFSMLGDGKILANQEQPPADEKKDDVEAVFDMLVYVKK